MNNFEIIGIDFATKTDFSIVTCICGQCKNVIACKEYNSEINEVEVPFFIKCPKCGIKFKKHILKEE